MSLVLQSHKEKLAQQSYYNSTWGVQNCLKRHNNPTKNHKYQLQCVAKGKGIRSPKLVGFFLLRAGIFNGILCKSCSDVLDNVWIKSHTYHSLVKHKHSALKALYCCSATVPPHNAFYNTLGNKLWSHSGLQLLVPRLLSLCRLLSA